MGRRAVSKYVTGPWVSETYVSEDGIAVIAVDPSIPVGCTPTRGMVAYVHSGVGACQTDDDAIATARLIAAAPDLLHSLEIILGALLLRIHPDERPENGVYPPYSAIREAQDAIARATGETK